jgi:N-acyl-D-aspartate/D-glutamate deacylase
MEDIVIRDALIVDGSGRPAFRGDVAASGGVITQVGGKAGAARREIRADGALATPGFVDVHTHYDAQVFWDPHLSPSSWHGVTSVVMGNCGIGFAPVRATDRVTLTDFMEGIEDISGRCMRAGLPWDWESFPQFLDAVERRPLAIDVGAQLPHVALRTYVMGERGVNNDPATQDDILAMSDLVREAMHAGALGFTGTRNPAHRSLDGRHAPGYDVSTDEVVALSRAVAASGKRGLLGFNVNFTDVDKDMAWLRRVRRETGLPVWCLIVQTAYAPELWTRVLAALEKASAEGEPVLAQSCGRPISYLLGLTGSRHPFFQHPSYKAIAGLPLEERVKRLRDPAFRARLLAEKGEYDSPLARVVGTSFDLMFRLGDPPDYEPRPEDSIGAQARRQGRNPAELVLDLLLERDGRELLLMPFSNYLSGDLSVVMKLLRHPLVRLGLGDGGAHVSRICDSSVPTFMLSHWARDRSRGPRFSIEEAVRLQTGATAEFYGLGDRGLLAVGKKADINLIDFDKLALHAPELAYDQPGDEQRLVQRADGYLATLVSGVPVFENGESTGALPGRLIRGARA